VCVGTGGGVAGAGAAEGGAKQHPETQPAPPLHHATVQIDRRVDRHEDGDRLTCRKRGRQSDGHRHTL